MATNFESTGKLTGRLLEAICEICGVPRSERTPITRLTLELAFDESPRLKIEHIAVPERLQKVDEPETVTWTASAIVTEGMSLWTDRARRVMQFANQEAQRLNHEWLGTEHMLVALLKEGSGVAASVLKSFGLELSRARDALTKVSPPGPDTVTMDKLPQTPRAKATIEEAGRIAAILKHGYVGTEHVLLALVSDSKGPAVEILLAMDVNLSQLGDEILILLGHGSKPGGAIESTDVVQVTVAGKTEIPSDEPKPVRFREFL